MKKPISLLIITLVLTISVYSQITFEEGYFIGEDDQKTECLIKNQDWRNNPTEFDFKLSEYSDVQTNNIEHVKEFGVYGFSKYIKAHIEIDRSSNNFSELGYNRNPDYSNEILFLKVLVEGKASLFMYVDGELTRYFYKKNDSEIKQLIHREFLRGENLVETNNDFRQQIHTDLITV